MISKYLNLAKKKLFSLCRSITGKGTEETLKLIKKEFPKLKISKIKSGKKIFDWKIPLQWDIFDAYILDNKNNKIVNFKKNNLHIVGYSVPINKKISLNNLMKKIYTIPKHPVAIPYRTSYYKKDWGFCISHQQKIKILRKYKKNDYFKVVIKSKLKEGFLKYGELIIKGKSSQEILISTYVCHPSMANNELSGIIVSMSLISYFLKKSAYKHFLSQKFLILLNLCIKELN
jgi:aminopeptidase-like protein